MIELKRILGIDLGTEMGWALYNEGEILYDGVSFKQTRYQSANLKYLLMANFLANISKEHGDIDLVYYEALTFQSNKYQMETWSGLKAILTGWCEKHEIPYDGVPVSTWKKQTIGNGGAAKDEIMFHMEMEGYDPPTEDAADALGVLLYGLWKSGIEI